MPQQGIPRKMTMNKDGDVSQRTRILRASAKLFAEQGYHAVAMTDIQNAVQLGRGALYHHIRSKEDLLYDIVREYIADLADFGGRLSRESDARERLQILGRHLIRKIAAYKAELTVCFREANSLTGPRQAEVVSLHAKYERVWRDLLVDGAEAGVLRPYDPILLKALLGMYFHSFLWIRPDGALNPDAVADKVNELALRMLVNQQPAAAMEPA
jgi:AcrR family transcriptional regulator